MNQTSAKELTLTALEARNLHNDIFELLTQIAQLAEIKDKEAEDAVVKADLDGGNF
jgi:hypothetical protein